MNTECKAVKESKATLLYVDISKRYTVTYLLNA
jgi:hypothetical protein